MPGFIHSSPAMTQLVEEVHKIRSSDVTVLVTGESGTGKELVARAIHAISSRRAKVFMPFNCTAVPKELSEGYLFGYRRGAFTGAVPIRTASFELRPAEHCFSMKSAICHSTSNQNCCGFCRKVRFSRLVNSGRAKLTSASLRRRTRTLKTWLRKGVFAKTFTIA